MSRYTSEGGRSTTGESGQGCSRRLLVSVQSPAAKKQDRWSDFIQLLSFFWLPVEYSTFFLRLPSLKKAFLNKISAALSQLLLGLKLSQRLEPALQTGGDSIST